MELSVDELFGQREVESVRGSGSEAEEDDSDDGDVDRGQNNPMEEAIEVREPGQEPASQQQQAIKPKRVIKNPQPKLDAQRLTGPRGIGVLQRAFKDVKFRGKGHEKEDLDILLKTLEHWTHRLFPRLPFKDTLEQIEKLGANKNVQVHMKRIRLDMYFESEQDGGVEDNVRRGIDEEEKEQEPQIDIFDELLGRSAFPTSQSTPLPPAVIPPSPSLPSKVLTSEQRERLEQNKRLAEERRLARLRKQEQERANKTSLRNNDFESEMESQDVFDHLNESTIMNVNTEDNSEVVNNTAEEETDHTNMETEEANEQQILNEDRIIEELSVSEKEHTPSSPLREEATGDGDEDQQSGQLASVSPVKDTQTKSDTSTTHMSGPGSKNQDGSVKKICSREKKEESGKDDEGEDLCTEDDMLNMLEEDNAK
ncbi:TIMELESS-interacting protein-like [Homarus americanus]|uniref:TIMELESS-interacting protein n=1 Tax=Homarus americanus TaxID=6706 RepID=A0A8J5J476_HOMAM|nr:TIMELESS-interacting protein-like [Homarus americanus]XP_042208929.1 TIMELESS-interacting protein-like [Homarus americanus]XP_042208930.1 TIMELESS-interacting protein-like [Homarus americanus]XP_042208931.1 TIMELESS-interacting protein-like [Homarus americanus]KAG7153732.1 TIMELESS-interacting protein-like [Homarus americanus]